MRIILIILFSLFFFVNGKAQNVGIGTSAPLKVLHVQQGGTSLLNSAFGNGMIFSTNSASGARIFLENLSGISGQKTMALINENVSGQGTTYFGSLADDGSTFISPSIFSMNHASGNVGIGTSTPTNKLSVNGNADFSGNVGIGTNNPVSPLQVGDFSTAIDNYITVKTQGGNVYKAGLGLYHYDNSVGWLLESNETDASFSLRHRNSPAGFNRQALIVDYYDNVGLGNYPTTKLDVNGSGWFRQDAGSLPLYAYKGVRVYFDSIINAGQLFAFDYEHGGSKNLVLQGPGGKLGIGTINPTAKLDVEGTVKIADGTQGAGKVLTSDANGLASWQDPVSSIGNTPGQMQYWNGSAWVLVASGQNNQTLTYCNGVPTWGPCPVGPPVVSIQQGYVTSGNTAQFYGTVIYDGNNPPVFARGICWSFSPNPDITDAKTTDGTGTGIFLSTLTGLTLDTVYYARKYATNASGTSYSSEIMFRSSTTGLPHVITLNPYQVSINTAVLFANVTAENGATITARGVCVATTPNPTTADLNFPSAGTTGIFGVTATGLLSNAIYHYRAYATNSFGTAYGADSIFVTLQEPPTVVLGLVTGGASYLDVTGAVVSAGTVPVTSRGICWSTNINPSLAGNHTLNGTGLGVFNAIIPGLSASTTYHVRAYATSAIATVYSADVTYTTLSATLPVVVATSNVTNILNETALSGGTISSIGGSLLIARGICWSTTGTPTLADPHSTDPLGIGTGIYTSTLFGLTLSSTYVYVRAYATNGAGTAYGPVKSFLIFTPVIGAPYKGGKLAYVLQNGDPGFIPGQIHGLIAAVSDQAESQWDCEGTTVGANQVALGTGLYNTNLIINASCATSTMAAKRCSDYNVVSGGITYNDWFLPSKNELNILYGNKVAIGGFASDLYWSSTENSFAMAWLQNFTNGNQVNANKSLVLFVRAVRAF